MSFVQYQFFVLLLTVLLTHWVVRDVRWQNALIVIASAVFYGWSVPWWLILLYASTGVDFVMAQLMYRSPAYKRVWLGMSLTANLSMLFYFKYFGFFLENLGAGLQLLGLGVSVPVLHIVLPAGISFYTFQTISYSIDVYRGHLRPRTNLLHYVAYVSFFPQIVAGPIERATNLLPQMERYRPFSTTNLHEGFALVMWGIFKKIVMADTIAPYVDKIFVLDAPQGPLVYLAVLAFTVQIYADFSAYTDIARGTAQMMGIHLVQNFDEPYLAVTMVEFWQRWHMSLSTWIRDYLTTPMLEWLGMVDAWRMAGVSLITMIIMGVWHGASWNYVLCGAYFGVCIGATHLFRHYAPKRLVNMRGGRWLAGLINWSIVMPFSGLLFREHSVARIVYDLTQNPFRANEMQWKAAVTVAAISFVFGVVPLFVHHVARRTVIPRLKGSPWELPVQSVLWSGMGVLIAIFYRSSVSDFIYFQF